MNQIAQPDFSTSHGGVTRMANAFSDLGRLTAQARSTKGVAGVLVAGGVSAVIVVAEQIVSAWADGHLLLAWIAMWVIVFALLAVFSDAVRGWPESLRQRFAQWRAAAARRAEDDRTWEAAQADPRLMAELQFALIRAEQEAAQTASAQPESMRKRNIGAAATAGLALLAITSTPANASNAVVIDFEQGRLILGWIGLWVVAVLTFVWCADKRISPLALLARYLDARTQRQAQDRADNAVLAVAHDDPRIMADIQAAVTHSCSLDDAHSPDVTEPKETPQPVRLLPAAARPSFRTSPMPGLPSHVQYLPG